LKSAQFHRTDHNGLTEKGATIMKVPGPDHPITITANPKRVRVSAGGVVIADTTHALTLKEATYPAVQYVPRQDTNMALLQRTERTTHCPYKGDANYFSVSANGKTLENSIWTYETPFPAMAEISGHLAFYPDKVTIEEVA
jgi:uncharacterized protein (DUF427 family)